jgi:hypothetical protein
MKQKTILILCLLALLIMPAAVSAQNMTISNLDLVSKQAVLVYSSGGVLLGSYNTSSNVISLPTSDFMIVLKPNAISRFSNPSLFLTDTVGALETYWVQVFMIGALFMGLIALASYGRRR